MEKDKQDTLLDITIGIVVLTIIGIITAMSICLV